MKHFDVIVVGGGHAGCEAAAAAARMGAQTALITLSAYDLGAMSCNPAIGGLGKGHLVREVDALDGIMGRAADQAGIQFRLLNRRKGPAVQGPRAQADRKLYRAAIEGQLKATENLTLLNGEVVDLLGAPSKISGVVLADASEIRSNSVILTTGTFLRGIIHIGDVSRPGGRMGDKPSVKLAQRIDEFGLSLGRLKTGTPPRLDGTTIDWQGLETQPGDDVPTLFSFLSKEPAARQIACGITHTNEKTHAIIRKNLDRSAMYGGHIDGVGPRYCPSIEDKIVRFSDKTSHQIFLEPEGLDVTTIYPNGISTSLPQDVQEAYVRSIAGLENALITQPGYAIEYDYVDPRALDMSLALRNVPGLFLAGQINGTTGYEEASAQGMVAGLSAAAQSLGRDGPSFSRSDSYIGVMLDDLISRGVSEPYRMFTSRAEFRLSLRADNADQRLTPQGIVLGCVGAERYAAFSLKQEKLAKATAQLHADSFTPTQLQAGGIEVTQDGSRRSLYQVLSFPKITFEDLLALSPDLRDIEPDIAAQLSCDALYSNYIARQKKDIEAVQRDEALKIPQGFSYADIDGLSSELRGKLTDRQPENLRQAQKVEGMTPAATMLLLAKLRQFNRFKAG
ncbi:MAG: tRNA uridine-5-carboxymethylaminomethyl(34) synthesis enzyme MnmG [Paracoccaceae bacterium]